MAQQEIEMILTRQLASYLAVPIFLVDPDGNLLYCNEPAERVLGGILDEITDMPMSRWSTMFQQQDEQGNIIPPDELPLVTAVKTRTPASRTFFIEGMDGRRRKIHVVGLPLIGQANRFLGAAGFFWEMSE
ncbi:MAG: PAS domain-containing protein [Chlorobi bacterium]|jgi:PAS domain-containing protein|nr:PAS domain-containing protein [Chlorobiota bacterium]